MCAGRASLFIDSTNKSERRTPMHNFEARYRAIVEKEPRLRHNFLAPYDSNTEWYDVHTQDTCQNSIARAAVCWWLAGKLPDGKVHIEIESGVATLRISNDHGWETVFIGDPAEAVMLGHEITLGIKEKP